MELTAHSQDTPGSSVFRRVRQGVSSVHLLLVWCFPRGGMDVLRDRVVLPSGFSGIMRIVSTRFSGAFSPCWNPVSPDSPPPPEMKFLVSPQTGSRWDRQPEVSPSETGADALWPGRWTGMPRISRFFARYLAFPYLIDNHPVIDRCPPRFAIILENSGMRH